MSIGPVELVVIAFPGNKFNGEILPELTRLLEAGTITIIDGILAIKDEAGDVLLVELDEESEGDVARLAELVDRYEELISDEDVEELTADLEPNSSAAILVFEHTWVKPLRDAIVDSGGELAATMRIPAEAVAEVLDALDDAEN